MTPSPIKRRQSRSLIVLILSVVVLSLLAVLFWASTSWRAHPPSEGESQKSAPAGDHFRLVCTFDNSLYACDGAANPFPAAGNVDVIAVDGRRGGAARFHGQEDTNGKPLRDSEKSVMVWDGANLPSSRGTIGFDLRWSGRRNWTDGRRTWLAVLPPSSDQVDGSSEGSGLVLYKDSDNSLVLGVYDLWKQRIRATPLNWGRPLSGGALELAEPDAIAVRYPLDDLPPEGWMSVRISWDREQGKVWLGVGDHLREAAADLRLPSWDCLLLGSPPTIVSGAPNGFDGELANLIIDERTPEDSPLAGREFPHLLPQIAQPEPGKIPATLLKDDPVGALMESAVRSQLGQSIRAQGPHGGWGFSVAWPSGLSFLSSQTALPYSKNFFTGCKDDNSAICAIRLLTGYLTLGDPKFLEAAERTGQALLRLQQPLGYWPYFAVWNPESKTFDSIETPEAAPLEDHVQSHPILLLWLLHDLTGKPEYLAAADRGRDFILHAQNPNGSWSHQFRPAIDRGWTFDALDAGEINDYTTPEQMLIMLAAYRRTADPKYLASYLRGADWLVDAFIDKGAVGWAQQYDENNQPIQGRHFEPAAVSLSEGIISAPQQLLQAYRLTHDVAYLEPLRRWREWMLDNRIFLDETKTTWGWHEYYDVDTGKAFRMENFKRLPADPKKIRSSGFSSLLHAIENPERLTVPRSSSLQAMAKMRLSEREAAAGKDGEADPIASRLKPNSLLESFNWEAGCWLYDPAAWGRYFAPSSVRVSLLCWSVFLHRMIDGQIPLDHQLATLDRDDFTSPVYFLVPPEELDKPLTNSEIAAARKISPPR